MGECYLLDLLLELIDFMFGFISERKIFHLERLIDNSYRKNFHPVENSLYIRF